MDYDQVRRNIYNRYLPGRILGGFLVVAGLLFAMVALLTSTIIGILVGLLLLWVAVKVLVATSRSEDADHAVFSKFEQRTFDWYCKTYPDNLRSGRIFCWHCGSGRISTRAIHQGTYHREHECTQCGKTLYYSPEQND